MLCMAAVDADGDPGTAGSLSATPACCSGIGNASVLSVLLVSWLGDAEAGQLFLNNFLKQDNVRADNLIAVSKRLLSVGAKAQARKVLDQAVQADALNQAALTSLVQLDLELKNSAPLAANVRKLLTMRKPSQAVLTAAFAE